MVREDGSCNYFRKKDLTNPNSRVKTKIKTMTRTKRRTQRERERLTGNTTVFKRRELFEEIIDFLFDLQKILQKVSVSKGNTFFRHYLYLTVVCCLDPITKLNLKIKHRKKNERPWDQKTILIEM